MKKLIKFILFAAIVAAIVKVVQDQIAQWKGLSETELRGKMHSKLDDKMPPEKVDEIADKVVEGMREKGMLSDEVPAEA